MKKIISLLLFLAILISIFVIVPFKFPAFAEETIMETPILPIMSEVPTTADTLVSLNLMGSATINELNDPIMSPFSISLTTEDNSAESFQYQIEKLNPLENIHSYYFNEDDWTINTDGIITSYDINGTAGTHAYLGIPEEINGTTVRGIDTFAFFESPIRGDIVSIYVPATIMSIGNGFYNSTYETISESTISDEVGVDDMSAFALFPRCYVYVDNDNLYFSSKDGCIYNKDKTYLYYISNFKYPNTDIILADTITGISAYANYSFYCNNENDSYTNIKCYINNEIVLNKTSATITKDGVDHQAQNSIVYIDELILDTSSLVGYNLEILSNSSFETAVRARLQEYIVDKELTETLTVEQLLTNQLHIIFVNESPVIEDNNENIVTGNFSSASQYSGSYDQSDTNEYVFSMVNLPARYITPASYAFIPATSISNQIISLELKRGTISLLTTNINNSTTYLTATYSITDSGGNIVATISTDNTGTAGIATDIPYGTYTITQTAVQDDYLPQPTTQIISITEDGQVINATFANTKVSYTIIVPKTLILSGSGSCTYSIGVYGTIRPDKEVWICPYNGNISGGGDGDFIFMEMISGGRQKDLVFATVTQNKQVWYNTDFSPDNTTYTTGTITAPITAGKWKGSVNFYVEIYDKQ